MYNARTLIPGWKLRDFRDKLPKDYRTRKYIAVSGKKFKDNKCRVFNDKGNMMVFKNEAIHVIEFPDKHGRDNNYELYYYEWKPQKELELF